MATEVLRPHNILQPHPAQRIRTTRRKPSVPSTRKSSPPTAAAAATTAGRRGHGRRPPVELYAGPAFSAASPEPSSLPLPQFSLQKAVAPVVDDAATRDLRRLLRLE